MGVADVGAVAGFALLQPSKAKQDLLSPACPSPINWWQLQSALSQHTGGPSSWESAASGSTGVHQGNVLLVKQGSCLVSFQLQGTTERQAFVLELSATLLPPHWICFCRAVLCSQKTRTFPTSTYYNENILLDFDEAGTRKHCCNHRDPCTERTYC